MRLKAIKLSGFKSFVDPTSVLFSTNMTGIVGPNGCGKSNTIDAVRWVMGESSAKYLRGDAMTDVIFNGSTERKPVGKASVELLFDNSDRTLKGEYASYNDINIRRQVTREGQSHYFLNGARCRRRDITDLFMGTGLGPRSYAIIEQGMISRLIEAKPDELRVYVEEAAGISRYKDRRRDTENRMRRTQENLERLGDIREELGRQLVHLERQASAAEKYKTLKAEEHQKKAELLALKWQSLNTDYESREVAIRELETRFESRVAEQRSLDAAMEEQRLIVIAQNDEFQSVQAVFYDIGARIARQEQKLEHQAHLASQLNDDLERVTADQRTNQQAMDDDTKAMVDIQLTLEETAAEQEMLALQTEESEEEVLSVESHWQDWQENWNAFAERAGDPARRSDVALASIQSLASQLHRADDVVQKREREQKQLESTDDDSWQLLEAEVAEQELRLEMCQEQRDASQRQLIEARAQQQQKRQELDNDRDRLNRLVQRKATLEALQKAALNENEEGSVHWLESHQLARKPRLAESLNVVPGWEVAVETALGRYLNAVMVDKLDALHPWLSSVEGISLRFWESSEASVPSARSPAETLVHKVTSTEDLSSILGCIQVADTLDDALMRRRALKSHESIMLSDGTWLGPDWLCTPTVSVDGDGGLLLRQQALEGVTEEWDLLDMDVEEKAADIDTAQLRIQTLEQQVDSLSQEWQQISQRFNHASSELASQRGMQEQRRRRAEQVVQELVEAKEQRAVLQEEEQEAQQALQQANEDLQVFSVEREGLQSQKHRIQQQLETVRQQARSRQVQVHQAQLLRQQQQSNMLALESALDRLKQEAQNLQQRKDALLSSQQQDHQQDLELMRAELQQLLEERQLSETRMQTHRQALEQAEQELKSLEQQRHGFEQQAQDVRNRLEAVRLECQALDIRRQTLIEQLSEDNLTLKDVMEHLSDEANIDDWQQALGSIGDRIRRLGNINLTAIDEFHHQTERQQYLDSQHDDLQTALDTLEGAIMKIDRETRARFQDTFNAINNGLAELFPKVFGGGHAKLELTGDDLLTTGVAIMARPPGKKNSTIHLLSGGEKALTAIALVFSIFQLNPAPFCMLDEVDAPLDDANVGRYGRLVKAMSDRVQFIYITHNKIAMEMAVQLLGVTMQEPGVSRIVSVNVEEAAEMIE